MRTGIRTTRKWTRTTRERNKEESKFLTVGDVLNTRRHIYAVFTDGPGLYVFPSNIHLQVEIHVHLTSTGWMSTCYRTLQYQNRNPRIRCAIVSAFTHRQTGSGHSEQNICLTKTNIKAVLIPWNKYIWIIFKLLVPSFQNVIRLHCRRQLVKYIQQNKTGETVFHIVVHTVPNTKYVGNKPLDFF